jgi:hypothetical protein
LDRYFRKVAPGHLGSILGCCFVPQKKRFLGLIRPASCAEGLDRDKKLILVPIAIERIHLEV